MPSNHLILCCPPLLLPSIFPSIRVFSNKSALHIRWPKYWSFNVNISPSNEHPGLISFKMDWMDLLAVQGTLKSLLQHHSSKASIFWCSAFFIVQLSQPYMATGKTIALTRQTFFGKVMSLLLNMLSRLVAGSEMPQICYGGGYIPWHVYHNHIFSLILKIIMSTSTNVCLLSLPGSGPSPSHPSFTAHSPCRIPLRQPSLEAHLILNPKPSYSHITLCKDLQTCKHCFPSDHLLLS